MGLPEAEESTVRPEKVRIRVWKVPKIPRPLPSQGGIPSSRVSWVWHCARPSISLLRPSWVSLPVQRQDLGQEVFRGAMGIRMPAVPHLRPRENLSLKNGVDSEWPDPDGEVGLCLGYRPSRDKEGKSWGLSWGRDRIGGPKRESGGGPALGAHDGAPAPPRARPLPGPGEETGRF